MDDTHSQAYYTANEGTDEESLPLCARQPKTSARSMRPAYVSRGSYSSSISRSSGDSQQSTISRSTNISESSTIRQFENRRGKRPSNIHRSQVGSDGSHSARRGRPDSRKDHRVRDSGRSRVQVDKMQQLQSSIQDGSPYFFTREERFADPPPFLDETMDEPPLLETTVKGKCIMVDTLAHNMMGQLKICITSDGIPAYNPDAFSALFGGYPCTAFHLKGSCTDTDCSAVHHDAKLTKTAKAELLKFVRSSPCAFGVRCTPTKIEGCLYLHICPLGQRCDNQDCGFRVAAFEGKGHEPNEASDIYAETQDEGQTKRLAERSLSMRKREEARFA